jgi:hypothetical protein
MPQKPTSPDLDPVFIESKEDLTKLKTKQTDYVCFPENGQELLEYIERLERGYTN